MFKDKTYIPYTKFITGKAPRNFMVLPSSNTSSSCLLFISLTQQDSIAPLALKPLLLKVEQMKE